MEHSDLKLKLQSDVERTAQLRRQIESILRSRTLSRASSASNARSNTPATDLQQADAYAGSSSYRLGLWPPGPSGVMRETMKLEAKHAPVAASIWEVPPQVGIEQVCGTDATLSNVLYWHGERANSFPISHMASSIAEALWKSLPPFEAQVADLVIQALSRLEAYNLRLNALDPNESNPVASGGDALPNNSAAFETVTEVFLHVRIDPTSGHPLTTDAYDVYAASPWAANFPKPDSHRLQGDYVSFEVWFVSKPRLGVQCAGQIQLPYDSRTKTFLNVNSRGAPSTHSAFVYTQAWVKEITGPANSHPYSRDQAPTQGHQRFFPLISDTYLVTSPKSTESFVPFSEPWRRAVLATRSKMYETLDPNSIPLYSLSTPSSTNEQAVSPSSSDDVFQFGILRQTSLLGGIPEEGTGGLKHGSPHLASAQDPSSASVSASSISSVRPNFQLLRSLSSAYSRRPSMISSNPLSPPTQLPSPSHRSPLPPPKPPPIAEPQESPRAGSESTHSDEENAEQQQVDGSVDGLVEVISDDEDVSDSDVEQEKKLSPHQSRSPPPEPKAASAHDIPQTPAYPSNIPDTSSSTPWTWLVSPAMSTAVTSASADRHPTPSKGSDESSHTMGLRALPERDLSPQPSRQTKEPGTMGSRETSEDSNHSTAGLPRPHPMSRSGTILKEADVLPFKQATAALVSYLNPIPSRDVGCTEAKGLDGDTQSHIPDNLDAASPSQGTTTSTSRTGAASPASLLGSTTSTMTRSSIDRMSEPTTTSPRRKSVYNPTKVYPMYTEALSQPQAPCAKHQQEKHESPHIPAGLRARLLATLWKSLARKLKQRKMLRAVQLLRKLRKVGALVSPYEPEAVTVGDDVKPRSMPDYARPKVVSTCSFPSFEDLEAVLHSNRPEQSTSLEDRPTASSSSSTQQGLLRAYLPAEPLPHLIYYFRHKLVHEMRILELVNCVLRGYQHLLLISEVRQ